MQAIIWWSTAGLVALVILYAVLDRLFPGRIARFEENVIAILLGTITLVAFTQVVARYGFNSGWSGALEFQRILFAWLILFGMSYGVRTGSHLGVDALIRLTPRPLFRALALFGALACFVYALSLLSSFALQWLGARASGGAIAYWSLNFRTGLGLDELRYPDVLQQAFGLQDRVHRWLAYLILPIGLALFLYRSAQAMVEIAMGSRELIIAGHEAEDLVAENRGALSDEALAARSSSGPSAADHRDRPPAALSDDGPGSATVDAGERMKTASRSPLGSAAGDRAGAAGARAGAGGEAGGEAGAGGVPPSATRPSGTAASATPPRSKRQARRQRGKSGPKTKPKGR